MEAKDIFLGGGILPERSPSVVVRLGTVLSKDSARVKGRLLSHMEVDFSTRNASEQSRSAKPAAILIIMSVMTLVMMRRPTRVSSCPPPLPSTAKNGKDSPMMLIVYRSKGKRSLRLHRRTRAPLPRSTSYNCVDKDKYFTHHACYQYSSEKRRGTTCLKGTT